MSFLGQVQEKRGKYSRSRIRNRKARFHLTKDHIVYTRKDLNIHDAMQHRNIFKIVWARRWRKETGNLTTCSLNTEQLLPICMMEEIDALTAEKHEQLEACAQEIADHEEQREQFKRRKNRMSDQEYERMDQMGDSQIQENICKMVDAEDYQKKSVTI